jgi:NhaP-type Na+/H+ or K+/H+ antiporter
MGFLNILLSLLIYVLVGSLIVWLAFLGIDLIVPAPVNRIAKGIVIFIVLIFAIYFAAGLFGLSGVPHLVLLKV